MGKNVWLEVQTCLEQKSLFQLLILLLNWCRTCVCTITMYFWIDNIHMCKYCVDAGTYSGNSKSIGKFSYSAVP